MRACVALRPQWRRTVIFSASLKPVKKDSARPKTRSTSSSGTEWFLTAKGEVAQDRRRRRRVMRGPRQDDDQWQPGR